MSVPVTTGFSANTADRLVIDGGAVYLNYGVVGKERLLGATRGGNSFDPGRTFRVMEADGAYGPVKGMRRRENVAPKIQANMLEFTVQNLIDAIAGAVGTDQGATTSIKGGEVTAASYLDNVAIVGKLSGSNTPVICIVKNALADAGFNLALRPKDEPVPQLTFSGHWDPANMDEEPWEIVWPNEVGSGS